VAFPRWSLETMGNRRNAAVKRAIVTQPSRDVAIETAIVLSKNAIVLRKSAIVPRKNAIVPKTTAMFLEKVQSFLGKVRILRLDLRSFPR
jgi:hypothetical protein